MQNLVLLSIVIFSAVLLFTAMSSKADLYDLFGGGAYQRDVDIIRLNDLKEAGSYLEEYKDKLGYYPFSKQSNIPVIVNIATKEQQLVYKNSSGPPYEHKIITPVDFIEELQKGLGRKIQMPFDLQRKPNGRQNFYSYMIVDGRYFFSVHLYHEYSFAEKIRDKWFKVQISNKTQAQVPIWDYEELMENEEYQTTIAHKVSKPAYFENLRDTIRNEVGF